MKKLKTSLKNISKISLLMMLNGTRLALGILILGIGLCKYNERFIGGYGNNQMGIYLVCAAISLFVQFIIGGLAFDCVKASRR